VVLISVRDWVDPWAIVRLEELGKLGEKKSNDLIRTRTRDLPACFFFVIGIVLVGVQVGPLGTAANNRPIVPAPGDYDGEFSGMIGTGNRSTLRNPVPVPHCPPQTPHAAPTRTRAAAVGSQRFPA
jgi:hypothetical protein